MATATATATANNRFNAEAAAWDANPDVHRASDGALQALLATYASAHPSAPPSSSSSSRIHLTPTNPQTDVLEIGCGTGLLSFRLAPYVRSILAIDAAEGMIAALEAKLSSASTSTTPLPLGEEGGRDPKPIITPLCILLEDAEDPRLPPAAEDEKKGPRKKFDLITSHLVLHHIPTPSLLPLLQTMHAALKPGGEIALTDFQDFGPEARKFHPEAKMAGVERHGIDAVWFASLLQEAGFDEVEVSPRWTMEKEVERFPGEWGEDGKRPQGGDELAKMDFPFLLCRGRKKMGVL